MAVIYATSRNVVCIIIRRDRTFFYTEIGRVVCPIVLGAKRCANLRFNVTKYKVDSAVLHAFPICLVRSKIRGWTVINTVKA